MKLNPILKLHPLTKLYFTLFVTISVIIIPSYIFAFTWFPILLVIAIIAGVGKQYLDIVVKALVFLLGIVFIMQLFFYPGDQVIGEWWIFEITKEGLQYGLVLTSRVLAMGSAFILFFRITEIRDFVKALEDLGMPPMGAYIVLSTLQIIPEMKRQANTIMEAQKTRGVETEGSLLIRAKAFIPILTPLILSSIASTEERAITLESRAFSAPTKKTSLHKLKNSSSDRTIPIVLLILMISLIVWRFFL
ncbi:energy-coupling factor transporter transmembrane component T [Viridibacillus sp. FSL R5-0477]|uniref:Cobalt transport protein n=1 Tax=Viridibacillus arenosi FSL R5-213 TaxID=1227360 RepID=W4F3P5_9BACL|nr:MULTISPECIES: energy-coupling factor transporter transmembrane component T [Viridibacillus]ETT87390.1 cobalt transport protein [Viridibacillus arenosi FSL R5-213]OMC82460.1 cobalt transporter [Viridibacillus sp. FSL H8-0123]OMC87792.1 cobalt transporter [Viridibacillus sp. FSL H7-0596]OMC91340.1 cobalt transporter [Viridibacillus arenosi]